MKRPHFGCRPAQMIGRVLIGATSLALICTDAIGQCFPACNKTNIECLNPSAAYTNARSVGKVITVNGGGCTGWVIAAPDLILTNRHCITTNAQAGGPIGNVNNMSIIMNFECSACNNGVPKPTTTFNVIGLIRESIAFDYAILRVNGNIAAGWGQLSVDAMPPVNGEAVYEIHHASGAVKGFDEGNVTGNVGANLCLSGTNAEFPISAIASQGASGAPVFRSNNNCVVGVCHCGPPCSAGFAIPMSSILPDAISFITAAGGTVIVCDAPGCPGSGNCYVAHSNAGCQDESCCASVCIVDPFCCNNSWDGICVNEALDICANCGDSGNGSCFDSHSNPGCNDSSCCGTVCAVDAFCCNVQWDSICVNEAFTMCAGCGDPNNGACDVSHKTTGCSDEACCKAVCQVDSFCCEVFWDGICANEAVNMCYTCGGSATQNCFVAHSAPTCSDAACCNEVCAVDSFCCNTSWDGLCVSEAYTMCVDCGSASTGPCDVAHSGFSCNDAACCQAVCSIDFFCCSVSWDSICVGEAADLCYSCGGVSTGSCFETHEPNCNNEACCNTVCAADSFCCNIFWDSLCVDGAFTLCAGCGSPNSGSCTVADGTPGCSDDVCCQAICLIDDYCCYVAWDSICVSEAQEICYGCGGVSTGDCFVAHSGPNCNDADCCEEVCAIDGFCCNISWDSICANEAIAMCVSCPGDIEPPNGNDVVDVDDLLVLINSWGPCVGCPGDLAPPPNGNNIVDVDDLLFLINNWGPCD